MTIVAISLTQPSITSEMRNFRLFLRHVRRNAGFTILNLSGLSIGIAVCIMIGLFVYDELNADRFHENSDRIVQFAYDLHGTTTSLTQYPLADALVEHVPGIEAAVRTNTSRNVLISDPSGLREGRADVLSADEHFFHIFSFDAIDGDATAALLAPDVVVVTESVASLLVGDDPVGRHIRIDNSDVTIGAVVRDVPANSTIQFDVVSLLDARSTASWRGFMYQTYALIDSHVSIADVETAARSLVEANEVDSPIYAYPLEQVYLSPIHNPGGYRGQIRYLWIFGSAAVFILLVAAINFVNLGNIQGLRRISEIGIRKSLGASRHDIAMQMVFESVVLSVSSLVIGLTLVAILLPQFNALFQKSLSLGDHPFALIVLSFGIVGVGTVASLYPATLISRFDPIAALRKAADVHTGRSRVQPVLTVLQFGISIVLIAGSVVIYQQLRFMQTTHLGFDGDQLVRIDLRTMEAWSSRDVIRQQVLDIAGVTQASVTGAVPPAIGGRLGMPPDQLSQEAATDSEEHIWVSMARVDAHFVETMGFELASGRTFDPELPSDELGAYVINETLARSLGWSAEEAVSKPLRLMFDGEYGRVIGVIKDFHVSGLHQEIPPVGFFLEENRSMSSSPKVLARLSRDDIPGTLERLTTTVAPFARDGRVDYQFVDEAFHELYEAEARFAVIAAALAFISTLIASLGLFALAAHASQRRTKEVGIRRVLGASVAGVLILLSRDFLKLVFIGFVIGAPLAFIASQRWLESFAYRIDLSLGTFVLVGVVAAIIAILTVSGKVLRTATTDPARCLKYE